MVHNRSKASKLGKKMTALIAEEGLSDDGLPEKHQMDISANANKQRRLCWGRARMMMKKVIF